MQKTANLKKNILHNVIGQTLPLVFALIAIPQIIGGLGLERFGVLTISWMVIGYFTFFDFGIGRAITQQISEKLGKGRSDEIPGLFWTSITLMVGLGLIGGVLILALSNWIVLDLLGIPDYLKQETLVSFWLLALGIPIVICSIGFRGALEAYQELI